MLKLNRLRIEIKTENGIYGFDETFNYGLNFIASEDNTWGKSSILAAVYYCLGFEEIIGGRNEKVLTAVYKTFIEDGKTTWPVLESGSFLEVSNGEEVITIFRAAKMKNRDSRLISVFYSPLDNIGQPNVLYEDMYVHMPNSATNSKGFHNYLEEFLHIFLPIVPASDDVPRKLYLQLIFSCMFIEQKHGWADIFSGMPILGIKESKKRVIEFILRLDTLDNEKKKEQLRCLENQIESEWKKVVQELQEIATKETCGISGVPLSPKILADNDLSRININKNNLSVDEYILSLQTEYENLRSLKPKIIDNFDQLQEELHETEKAMSIIEQDIRDHLEMMTAEETSIKTLINNLEIINIDIRNNKDAARLRNLGSDLNCCSSSGICPVCNQTIQDALLPDSNNMQIMSIDENIRHLKAQKDMLEFALSSHKQNKDILWNNIQGLEKNLFTLRKLAKSLRSDLYSTNDAFSETIILKRLKLESDLNSLSSLKEYLSNRIITLVDLSKKWENFLKDKSNLPSKKFTESDNKKLKLFRTHFINNLTKYGYKSILNLNKVEISLESYLPIIEGFDMKFDSSASDNIRAIWAFIMSLIQTSIKEEGNHPRILIFDEPAQQSIIIHDMEQFFKSIVEVGSDCQVIVGITLKDTNTKQAIQKLPSNTYKMIKISNKAFVRFYNEEDQ